jgi:general secretion pathway protein C
MILSFGLLFLDDSKRPYLDIEQKKSSYISTFPKFFPAVLEQKKETKNIKKKDKIGDLILKACYVEKGREFVVIAEGSKSIFVSLGDSHKGAKLVDVQFSSAIFLKDGEYIKLEIKRDATAQKLAPKREASVVHELDGRYIAVKRGSIKKYVQNPQDALKDIRIAEIREGKKFVGLRLSFVRRGSLFDRMNLKKGDIIRSVDGNELKSIMDLLPYYKRLDSIAGLLIGFERDGEMKEIMYEIN